MALSGSETGFPFAMSLHTSFRPFPVPFGSHCRPPEAVGIIAVSMRPLVGMMPVEAAASHLFLRDHLQAESRGHPSKTATRHNRNFTEIFDSCFGHSDNTKQCLFIHWLLFFIFFIFFFSSEKTISVNSQLSSCPCPFRISVLVLSCRDSLRLINFAFTTPLLSDLVQRCRILTRTDASRTGTFLGRGGLGTGFLETLTRGGCIEIQSHNLFALCADCLASL
ncbi:hypothetical protein VTK26DRAFT_2639 [Humicola hyalothermophila]